MPSTGLLLFLLLLLFHAGQFYSIHISRTDHSCPGDAGKQVEACLSHHTCIGRFGFKFRPCFFKHHYRSGTDIFYFSSATSL